MHSITHPHLVCELHPWHARMHVVGLRCRFASARSGLLPCPRLSPWCLAKLSLGGRYRWLCKLFRQFEDVAGSGVLHQTQLDGAFSARLAHLIHDMLKFRE